MEFNKIYNMDCLAGLKLLEDCSIDLIVSDPPYQLDSIKERFGKEGSAEAQYGTDGAFKRASKWFMGKEWDILPTVETLKECLRVLKDGAFSFWLMTSRQDSQAEFIIRLKEAGFNIGFSPIYWAYLTGFPKAGNISKMVDKRMGAEREVIGQKKLNPRDKKVYTANKHKGFLGTNTFKTYPNMQDISLPYSEEAKKLDGSYAGMQLKPAVEVVIVAMKPLSEKTYVDQALKNRKGITWLDDCRIPYDGVYVPQPRGTINTTSEQECGYKECVDIGSEKGRFPANLLVSDNAIDNGKKQSQGHWSKSKVTEFGEFGGGNTDYKGVGERMDGGSLSSYFDIDKWFREHMSDNVKKTFPFLFVAKPSTSEKDEGCKHMPEKDWRGDYGASSEMGIMDLGNASKQKAKNNHPTVKPIKLFSYLITLGSRENDVILDPYIGSGTLGISARLTTRKFIGFEREKEYFEIAQARIKKYMEQTKLFEF